MKKLLNQKDNRIIAVIIAVIIISIGFISKTLTKSYAISDTLADTLISSQGDIQSTRINLFNSLEGDEAITLIPFYASDDSGNKYTAYCLEKNKGWIVNKTLTKNKTPLDKGYVYIIQNAYPTKNLTGDSAKDNYLTQVAIWFYQDRSNNISDDTNGVLTANQKNTIKNSEYYQYIDNLISNAVIAKNSADEKKFTLDSETNCGACYSNYEQAGPIEGVTTNKCSLFRYDEETGYFISKKYVIKTTSSYDNYQVSVDNANVKIYDDTDHEITNNETIGANKKFYLKIHENNVLNAFDVHINVIINYKEYESYSYNPPSDATNMQISLPAALVPVAKQQTLNTTISIPTRNLALTKQDENNNPLNGATLVVRRYLTDEIVASFTTTEEKYIIKGLIPGLYIVEETSSPLGYYGKISSDIPKTSPHGYVYDHPIAKIMVGDVQSFDMLNYITSAEGTNSCSYPEYSNIILNDAIKKLNIESGVTGGEFITNYHYNVKIRKIDSKTKEPIKGAILKILDQNNNEVTTIETENDYVPINSLKEGTYKIKEEKAPSGYLLNTKEQTFKVSSTNSTLAIDFENSKNKTSISKKDSATNDFVSGAHLILLNSENQQIKEWTTTNEEYIIEGLKEGTYTIKEEKAPSGYILNNNSETFEITANQTENKKITLYNTKNQIVINKVDKETKKPIEGVKLQLLDNNDQVIDTFITKETPYTVSKLKEGTYKIKELESKKGYTLDKKITTFTVDSNTKNLSLTLENSKNTLNVGKVDKETHNYIAGATLKLTNDDKSYTKTIVTTNSETVLKGLPSGNYTLEEIKAPDGYVLNSKKINITIKDTDTSLTVLMENQKSKVTINKIDSDTNQQLKGVILELSDKNKTPLKTFTTEENATVITNLQEGTYYLKELKTIDGYQLDNTYHQFKIDSNHYDQEITIKNHPTIIYLGKIDANTKKYIAGATLELNKKDGNMTPITFVSTNSPYQVKGLSKGIYTLKELKAPEGYIGSDSLITFEVTSEGKTQNINITNEVTTIKIVNKKIVVNSPKGYKYVIKTTDGHQIEKFETSGNDYTSKELENNNYILKQIESPEGTIINSKPIYFTISDKEEENIIKYTNDFTKLKISKKDLANSKELEGATLNIINKDGKKVDTWTSTTTPHYIEKLPVGTYTLEEITSPDNYILNKAIITFEIKETGDIQTATMFNSKLVKVPNTSKIEIIKYIIGSILAIMGGIILIINYKKQKSKVK